ncbi:response regulator [Aerococcaceae bacterium NML180378]|nr:response regulator [Aerococcaceae bacterium NML180378]
MKKIVLVDDEIDVRQSISALVDWEKFGFELVGEAGNGQEALSVIEELQPDVVLTDIRMPIMDGIEMSHNIHELDPTIRIIFLSGHERFEYAQSAIRLNIEEYLLKPISIEDIEQVLQRVGNSIDEERQQALDMKRMTQEYMKTLDAIRRSYLVSLTIDTHTRAEEEKLRNLAELYQVNLAGDMYVVVNIALLKENELQGVASVSPQVKDRVFAEELSWVSYLKNTQTIVRKYMNAEVFRQNDTLTLIISGTKEELDSNLDTILLDIQQTFIKTYDLEAIMGVSRCVAGLHELKRAYRQATDALNYCRSSEDTQCVYMSDIEALSPSSFELDEMIGERLVSAVKVGDESTLKELSRDIYQEYNLRHCSAETVYMIYLELTSKILRIYGQMVREPDRRWSHHFMDEMLQARTELLEVVYQKFLNGTQHALRQIRENRDDMKESLTVQGLKIMRQEYSDPNFNQKSLASLLHISPNYLSSLFKKETAQSFKEHLIEIRMQKAQELLLSTDKKILEIAQLTGYVDQHYFSYGFKKYFGKSPRQMREEQGERMK